jgi:hypothetical protein
MGVANSSAADSPAEPAPDRRIAQDALSLAEDAAAVRHGRREPLSPRCQILLRVSDHQGLHFLRCVATISEEPDALIQGTPIINSYGVELDPGLPTQLLPRQLCK